MNCHTKANRVPYIDISRFLAIFLVLVGHIVDSDTSIKTVVYSFHMPLFFLLSGMVYKDRDDSLKNNLQLFFCKKMRTIVFPYILWGCIYAALSLKNILLVLYGSRETLIKAGSLSSLWFFPVLLCSQLMIECLLSIKLSHKYKSVFLGICAIILMFIGFIMPHNKSYGNPFGFDIAFVAAGFIIIGFISKKAIENFSKLKLPIKITLTIILMIVFIIVSCLFNKPCEYVLMANADYNNKVVFIVVSLLGSSICIFLGDILSSMLKKTKYLICIGQNTFAIFLVHKPIISLLRKIAVKVSLDYNNIFICIIIAVIALLISYMFVLVIEKFSPQIVGKQNK